MSPDHYHRLRINTRQRRSRACNLSYLRNLCKVHPQTFAARSAKALLSSAELRRSAIGLSSAELRRLAIGLWPLFENQALACLIFERRVPAPREALPYAELP